MSILRLGMAFVIVTAILWTGGVFAQDDSSRSREEVRMQATSLIEACIQALEGIESGDCLVDERRSYDTVDQSRPDEFVEKYQSQCWHRIVFDHRTERYAYVRNFFGRKELLAPDLGEQEDRQSVTEEVLGLVINSQERMVRTLPDEPLEKRHVEVAKLLMSQGVLDVRVAGLEELNHSPLYGETSRSKFRTQILGLCKYMASLEKLPNGNYRLDSSFEIPNTASGRKVVQTSRIEIDPDRFVFVKVSADAEDSLDPSRRGSLLSRSVEWQEIQNVMVPRKITYRTPRTRALGERKVTVLEETTYEIQWLSVNKDLEEQRFDSTLLNSRLTMLEFVDPRNFQKK